MKRMISLSVLWFCLGSCAEITGVDYTYGGVTVRRIDKGYQTALFYMEHGKPVDTVWFSLTGPNDYHISEELHFNTNGIVLVSDGERSGKPNAGNKFIIKDYYAPDARQLTGLRSSLEEQGLKYHFATVSPEIEKYRNDNDFYPSKITATLLAPDIARAAARGMPFRKERPRERNVVEYTYDGVTVRRVDFPKKTVLYYMENGVPVDSAYSCEIPVYTWIVFDKDKKVLLWQGNMTNKGYVIERPELFTLYRKPHSNRKFVTFSKEVYDQASSRVWNLRKENRGYKIVEGSPIREKAVNNSEGNRRTEVQYKSLNPEE